jgi:ABC-type antimicrobial peptide transport system permease subunit
MHVVVTLATGFLMLTGLLLFIRLDFYETGLSSDILSALGVTKLGIVVEKLVRLGIVAFVGIGAGLLLGGALGSFVSERIADVYASDTTEAASRAATIGFDTAYYVVTLLVFGLIGMLVFALSQGRRQVIGYQGRSD